MLKGSSQRGFSLVQVLVAVAIMGGLALVMMQMTDNQIKQQKTIELKVESGDVATIIRQTLTDREACESTFVGMAPGDLVNGLRLTADANQKPFAEVGAKFKTFNIVIKEMHLLSRPEEISTAQRDPSTQPISSYTTGSGFAYLKVTLSKQVGVAKSDKPQRFYGSKDTSIFIPIKANFYDLEIIKDINDNKLDEACWKKAALLGVTCTGAPEERCATIPIDEDGNGTDYVVDAKTGARLYLAECRIFRDDSPLMECSI